MRGERLTRAVGERLPRPISFRAADPGLVVRQGGNPMLDERVGPLRPMSGVGGAGPVQEHEARRTSPSGGNTTVPDSVAPACWKVTFMPGAPGDQTRLGRDRRDPDVLPLRARSRTRRSGRQQTAPRVRRARRRAAIERPSRLQSSFAIASSHSPCFSRSRARTAGVVSMILAPASASAARSRYPSTSVRTLARTASSGGSRRGRAARLAAMSSPTSSSQPSTTSSL